MLNDAKKETGASIRGTKKVLRGRTEDYQVKNIGKRGKALSRTNQSLVLIVIITYCHL